MSGFKVALVMSLVGVSVASCVEGGSYDGGGYDGGVYSSSSVYVGGYDGYDGGYDGRYRYYRNADRRWDNQNYYRNRNRDWQGQPDRDARGPRPDRDMRGPRPDQGSGGPRPDRDASGPRPDRRPDQAPSRNYSGAPYGPDSCGSPDCTGISTRGSNR
jgi:hypothetical protein